jgi:hypothetical protein
MRNNNKGYFVEIELNLYYISFLNDEWEIFDFNNDFNDDFLIQNN